MWQSEPIALDLSGGTWEVLTAEQRQGFAPSAPDFLIEVRSPSDRIAHLKRKMEEWIRNGCRLAWLVDPIEEQVSVYRTGADVEVRPYIGVLTGEDVLPDFSVDLGETRVD